MQILRSRAGSLFGAQHYCSNARRPPQNQCRGPMVSFPASKCHALGLTGSRRGLQSAPVSRALPVGEYGERLLIAEDEAEDIKLECDESGCVLVIGGKKTMNISDAERTDGVLHCSLSGCYFSSSPPTREFKVLEGSGWRLGYETNPDTEDSFAAMVGAGGWSIALTASEFHDFCLLVQMLRKGIITMDQDGVLGRDDIVMQVERGSLWMECVLHKKTLPTLQRFLKFGGRSASSAFEIRFILSGKDSDKRQAEGYWPAEAVMDMLKRIDEEPSELLSSSPSASPQAGNGGAATAEATNASQGEETQEATLPA